MKKKIFGLLLILVGSGIGGLLAAGYSLCSSSNHPVPAISDSGIQRIEIPGEEQHVTVAWMAVGTNGRGLILAHGNSSDRTSMVPRMRYFQSLGYTVIAPDLNAHGETLGRWKTFGYRESQDIEGANHYLRRVLGLKWVGAIGTSLGGASILKAESNGHDLDALIIESVFRDIRTAARNRLEMKLGRIGSYLEPLLTAQIPLWMGLSREDLKPMNWARQCRAPILILAGEADQRAKPWESEAIFSQVPATPKHIRIFKGAKHQDLFAFDPLEYEREVEPFLREVQKESVSPK